MTDSSKLPGNETATAEFDECDIAALDEAISQVLSGEADRLNLHKHIDGKSRLDRVLWDKAVELGWPAIGLPENVGGLGFGARGLDRLHRHLGRHVAPGPFLPTLSAAQALDDAADADLKSQWLPGLAAGECRLAVPAQIEAAPDLAQLWILGDEETDFGLLPLGGEEWGIVPLKHCEIVNLWDRTRAMMTIDLTTAEPVARLLAEAITKSLSHHLSLAVASDSIGGARAITEQTIAYMKEREQFGKPIASFQALKHRIADLMTLIVSGEEIVALAVEAAASGSPDADIWAKLAKSRCTETFSHVAGDCLQLHGGVGFTWEYDVHMYLKRARLNELLVSANTKIKDDAAAALADSVRSGRQPLELA